MPWTDPARLFEHCTGCGACVAACPESIVMAGRGNISRVDFARACTFCGACAAACPEPVFVPDRDPPWRARARIGPACLEAAGTACRACQDTCPEAAISARPRLGGAVDMIVDDAQCTGCGACVSLCPVQAIEVAADG